MNAITESIVTIILAIVGLAMVAVLVSRGAQTSSVIQAGASGVANDIGVAISPVTGANIGYTTGYPSSNTLINAFGT